MSGMASLTLISRTSLAYEERRHDGMTVVYKSSEVTKRLDVKESVFKKYVSLNKEGFLFQKKFARPSNI